MKRFVTVAFSCCLLGGVIVGLGIAQDQPLDPFAQREPDAPRERDSDRRESEEDVERDERRVVRDRPRKRVGGGHGDAAARQVERGDRSVEFHHANEAARRTHRRTACPP